MAYSRLQSVEEKRNNRKAAIFVVSSIAAIALLFFVGIPLMGKLTVFISDLRGSTKSINKNDTTPPGPPNFNYIAPFTNQQKLTISGNTEPGATVKLTFNGAVQENVSDKNGIFSFDVTLQSGENSFSAISIDTSGNQSQKSKDYTITFDNKPPALTIISPSDGASFFGSAQRMITIQGTTDPNSRVNINDRIASVDNEGNFQYTLTLNDGANTFNIKSTDQAGNSTEKTLTLNFSP